jgi:sugar O-acyltransferase (sialic acid O-acetyltransferase NeuD family)
MKAMVASDVQPLLIFPCNGNGIEALDCLGGTYELIGFVDDAVEKRGTRVAGHPVYDREAFTEYPRARVLAVPGSPSSYKSRPTIVEGLGVPPDRFTTVVHPRATVSPLAHIGRNVLIMAGVVMTSNAVIGDHVCILPNTVVHHDVVVGRWSLIGSGVSIAGSTAIGDNCYIGSGSSIIHGVSLGDKCLVGLGSNVICSVGENARIAGNPAREI